MKTGLVVIGLVVSLIVSTSAAVYDFSAVDTLLSNNLTKVFKGGVVCLVAKNDTLIYTKELGDLTRSSKVPIASTTKTFSGALILALCDNGIISLDDSVGKYIPSYTQNGKNKFTIRNCFSHTAGWNTSDQNGYLNTNQLTLQQVADSIAVNYTLAYTPGTAFSYTGIAMQIAGAMAEKAAGKTWNNMFNTYISEKCSLTNTDYGTSNNPRIAGGISSTPDDLMKLATMIRNNGMYHGTRVISEAGISEMWKDQTGRVPQKSSPYPFGPKNNNPYNIDTVFYGVGDWLDVQNPATGYVEVISGNGAFGTSVWIDRCTGVTGVILTQSLGGLCWPTEFQIMDIIRAQVGGACGSPVSIQNTTHKSLPVVTRNVTGRSVVAYDIRGRMYTVSPGGAVLSTAGGRRASGILLQMNADNKSGASRILICR